MRNCVFEFQLRYNMYIQGTNEHDNVMVLFEFSQTQQVGNTDSRLHYQHAIHNRIDIDEIYNYIV